MSYKTTPHIVDVFDCPEKWTRSHWHTVGRNHAEGCLARVGKDGNFPSEYVPAYLAAIKAGAEVELERHDGSMQMYYWMGYLKTLESFEVLSHRQAA